MALTIINKDAERTWVVCQRCGAARDARKGGSCKCGNIRAEVQKDGSVLTVTEDSDAVEYDNSK